MNPQLLFHKAASNIICQVLFAKHFDYDDEFLDFYANFFHETSKIVNGPSSFVSLYNLCYCDYCSCAACQGLNLSKYVCFQIYDFIPPARKMPLIFHRIFYLFKVGLKYVLFINFYCMIVWWPWCRFDYLAMNMFKSLVVLLYKFTQTNKWQNSYIAPNDLNIWPQEKLRFDPNVDLLWSHLKWSVLCFTTLFYVQCSHGRYYEILAKNKKGRVPGQPRHFIDCYLDEISKVWRFFYVVKIEPTQLYWLGTVSSTY